MATRQQSEQLLTTEEVFGQPQEEVRTTEEVFGQPESVQKLNNLSPQAQPQTQDPFLSANTITTEQVFGSAKAAQSSPDEPTWRIPSYVARLAASLATQAPAASTSVAGGQSTPTQQPFALRSDPTALDRAISDVRGKFEKGFSDVRRVLQHDRPEGVVGQSAYGFLDSFTLGLLSETFEALGVNRDTYEPQGVVEALARGGGEIAGFFAGPLRTGMKVANRTFSEASTILRPMTAMGIAGLISANEQLAEVVEDPSFETLGYDIGNRLIAGGTSGALGAAFGYFDRLPKFWQRAAGNVIATQLIRGLTGDPTLVEAAFKRPSPRDISDLIYDVILDIGFSIQQPITPAQRRGVRRYANEKAQEILDAELDRQAKSHWQKVLQGEPEAEQVREGFRRLSRVEKLTRIRNADPKPDEAQFVETVERPDGTTLEFYEVPVERIVEKKIPQKTPKLKAPSIIKNTFKKLQEKFIIHGFDITEAELKTDMIESLSQGLRTGTSVGEQASSYPMMLLFSKASKKNVPHRPGDFITTEKTAKPKAVVLIPEEYRGRRPFDVVSELANQRAIELEEQGVNLSSPDFFDDGARPKDRVLRQLMKQMDEAMEFGEFDVGKFIDDVARRFEDQGIPVFLAERVESKSKDFVDFIPVVTERYQPPRFEKVDKLVGEKTFFTVDRSAGQSIMQQFNQLLGRIPSDVYLKQAKIKPPPEEGKKPTIEDYILSEEMKRFQSTDDLDVRNPVLSKDHRLATEEALNALPIDIKTWNQTMDNLSRHNFKESYLEFFKSGLQDTALLWARVLGKAGTRAFQLAVDGYDKLLELHKRDKIILDRADAAAEQIRGEEGSIELQNALWRVAQALQNRRDASNILKSDMEFEIYDAIRKGYDHYRAELEGIGVETIDDYMTRIKRDIGIVEAMQDVNNLNKRTVDLNDALAGKVSSRFLNAREKDIEDIKYNPIELYRIYGMSVSRTISFKPFMLYYMRQFEGDIPAVLKQRKDFGQVNKEFVNWIREFVRPEFAYGKASSMVMKSRSWVYKNLLLFNIKASLENLTQKDFAKAFTHPDSWPIANKIYKNRHNLEQDMPAVRNIVQRASKDKTFLTEMTEAEMYPDDPHINETQWQKTRTKIKEIEPFQAAERSNWDYSEIMGIVETVRGTPRYQRLVAEGHDPVQSIETVLRDFEVVGRRALINAQALSQQTQLMPGFVASPRFFRSVMGKVLGMFNRFPFGQLENIILSFQTSGSNGASALRILRRGIDEEVVPVEELQKMETFRKAIDELIKLRKKSPNDVTIDGRTLRAIKKVMGEFEQDMSAVITRLQPINRAGPNQKIKGSQVRLWSQYTAKRAAYLFFYNVLANVAMDALGYDVPPQLQELSPLERAWRSTWHNLIPFFWDTRNPNALLGTPLLPDFTSGGVNVSKRSVYRGLLRWGMNVVPFAGAADRLTGRIGSDAIVDFLAPIESAGGSGFGGGGF